MVSALVLFAPSAHAEPQRPRQEYGGPPSETTLGDALLWIPRVVFFPIWVVSEYLIRKPIGALVVVAERDQWPREFIDFFTFGDRRQVTIFPSALFDFGLLPSVGFNAQWKHFLAEPSTLKLHFGFWGPDWVAVRAVEKIDLDSKTTVGLDAHVVRRQDNPFYGMGPHSHADPRVRYQSTEAEASWTSSLHGWKSSSIETSLGVRSMGFGLGGCCGNPSLEVAVRDHLFNTEPAPPGFQQSYTAIVQHVEGVLDSRRPRPDSGSGARVDAHVDGGFVPSTNRSAPREAWVRYGGSAGVALDVTGKQRVLSLTLSAEFADPLLGIVPFTEQVTLGGDKYMRGYLRNRLIDRSAAVGTLKYTWPVWVYLDGVIEMDIGNVFGEHLDGFDTKLLRMTSGIGVRSNGERDTGFELLVAGGTDPFDQGFHVSSFRFVLGSHHGF